MRLSAGDLDQRITLQESVGVRDEFGQVANTWAEVATVWAKAEPLSGREFFAAAQMVASATVRFRIRYRPGVTAAMRVLWRGQPHEIVAPPIDVAGLRDELQLMCMTGMRNGQ